MSCCSREMAIIEKYVRSINGRRSGEQDKQRVVISVCRKCGKREVAHKLIDIGWGRV